ncbi:hypothetical protein SCHPADRAFT_643326 [Schizopora paradoxa]|uniref:Uncharacterized protein n=1 Tax=Schizopora paradoxa TaxID=27342 RepID=A0A0H2R6X6_9AGAM|nr:hypothetical protein SCHPADRAFT_643326 [Schizopora paradoxa]
MAASSIGSDASTLLLLSGLLAAALYALNSSANFRLLRHLICRPPNSSEERQTRSSVLLTPGASVQVFRGVEDVGKFVSGPVSTTISKKTPHNPFADSYYAFLHAFLPALWIIDTAHVIVFAAALCTCFISVASEPPRWPLISLFLLTLIRDSLVRILSITRIFQLNRYILDRNPILAVGLPSLFLLTILALGFVITARLRDASLASLDFSRLAYAYLAIVLAADTLMTLLQLALRLPVLYHSHSCGTERVWYRARHYASVIYASSFWAAVFNWVPIISLLAVPKAPVLVGVHSAVASFGVMGLISAIYSDCSITRKNARSTSPINFNPSSSVTSGIGCEIHLHGHTKIDSKFIPSCPTETQRIIGKRIGVTNKPLPLVPIRAPSFNSFSNEILANAALTVPPSAALSDTLSDASTPRSAFFAITKDPSECSCGSGYNYRNIGGSEEVQDFVDGGEDGRRSSLFSDSRSKRQSSLSPSSQTSDGASTSSSVFQSATVEAGSGMESDSTPRASLDQSVVSSAMYLPRPIFCSSPVSESVSGPFEDKGGYSGSEMKSLPSSPSSFRTTTPTSSSFTNDASVRSIVDLPMDCEDSLERYGTLANLKNDPRWPWEDVKSITSSQKSCETTSSRSHKHRSLHLDKSARSSSASHKTSEDKHGLVPNEGSSRSRISGRIERIWKSRSLSSASTRTLKSQRSSVYDPELGEDHDYFQAGTSGSKRVYGPFRLSTLDK